VYLSPLLPAARRSEHGYDVVGFDGVDRDRGGVDGWTRFLAAVRARGLRTVVDIVPNHTGIADAAQNAAWWDVLRLGRSSRYAPWFDIEWSRGPLLLPVLGDDVQPGELTVVDGEVHYADRRFPLAPGTEPSTDEPVEKVLERQHYRLVNHRRADTDQSYRRFFAVTTLAGLRVEDEAVFDATHQQVWTWLRGDHIDGVRIDHPDGLADPLRYLLMLRQVAGADVWIIVEKILEPGETLPQEWPVAGTTGYDAIAEVQRVLVDPAGEAPLDELYQAVTDDRLSFAEHAASGKRHVATTILRAEVLRLARLAPSVRHAEQALNELLVAFPVYRSYLPTGAEHLTAAALAARTARPDLAVAIDELIPRLSDPSDELCVRFQQTSGAVMAKGVEDTAYYRYTRFIALNEVGGDPTTFGCSLADFHAAMRRRQQVAPHGMTTLSTHDTKRGEDVRARLAVLAEVPQDWAAVVRTLMRTAPVPDAGFGYLLWQTFAGAGFIDRERMHAYAEKAMREAAVATNWIDPDPAFEGRVHAAVDAGYDDPAVHGPLAEFVARITPHGWTNSLSQKLIQLAMPGVPDVYQGTELWDDSLVDPDNRRPVDFRQRRALLDALDERDSPPPVDETGAAKLWLVSRALRLRGDWPDLFTGYRPLAADGPAAEHLVAFDRGGAIAMATRLPVRLERRGGWQDTTLDVGASTTDVLTGRQYDRHVDIAAMLADYPVALLVR
jgi:(1->4)-alpha-D-glucan 1-alpha-D-glucosylmutase